ncbi:uncharacterized protein DDB_G0283357-like isoform X1 [Pieris napi]|uniref:uncharacterized protein DDB_G0283357-like isoform X1 n=1 Tax=Pieris napi TaxID=78633 RepID=UPI001FB8FFFE|nr:uncharacterized protein DDB_G0283357-like isoform X1 [Pieris napi]
MIEVFIFGVLALSVSGEKVIETFENGATDLLKQGSDYLHTPQRIYFKGDSLNDGHEYNVLNQNPIIPMGKQNIGHVAKYDSYAHHSNSRSYENLGPNKNEYIPYRHHDVPLANTQYISDNIHGLEVTNKIPSMKLDQPYYRTPPKSSIHDYNHVLNGDERPKTYEELALKNLCVDCSHYRANEYSQNPTHYQHEKSALNEQMTKDIYNPYLVHNSENNHGYSHGSYTDAESEKQRLLDKINYIYHHGKDMQYTKPSQNNTNPREPLYKSDPHYLHYKPYYSDNNFQYKVKANGLFPYGPKHVDYYPVRVNNYYPSHNYNDKPEPKHENYYGHNNDASDRYTPNVYSEALVYPRSKYEYETFNTTNNETNTNRNIYYNPYFDFAPDARTVNRDNNSYSEDLTAKVLKNLLYSKNKYPSSYSNAHPNGLYNSEPKHFYNNYAHENNAPHNYRHLNNEVKDIISIQYPKNNYNQYNGHSNSLYHNGHKNAYHVNNGNYVPNRHFKDIVEEVNRILYSRKNHVPYVNAYYKDNHEHITDVHELGPKKQQEPYVNDYAGEHLIDPKNINNAYGQLDMHQHYKHFKDVVEEAKKLLEPKNKHDAYANLYVSDFDHSRPHERHYGKLTHPFDRTSVGVLHPYKVRPNPYILPEYRRYQSQYNDHPRNYNHHENLAY